MSSALAAGAPLVIGLLTYIEQVEKLKVKAAFSVPEQPFAAYQHDVQGLPEVQFNVQHEADDVWLKVPRLREIAAPEPDEELKPWITLPKTPEKAPGIREQIVSPDDNTGSIHIRDRPDIRELFDWYVENQWTPWANAERPRRKTIVLYNRLFSLQQAIASDGAEAALELVWGIGYATWKKEGFASAVRHPLLTQACEVTLNERSFELEIRPRDVEPKLEADCYSAIGLPGVRQLEAFFGSACATGANRLNPFEPSTYDRILKAAVGYLDPSGAYDEGVDDTSLPPPSERLKITNTWVLFARNRSGDIFIQDVQRLKQKVAQASTIPSVIRSFVERGETTVRVQPEQSFRGLSTSEPTAGAMELYFPMPYNDEQVSIVQKLYANDGVVVQGPPGTGKTHTIANVICHYLAQGKRVLVTAKTESALAVLQEKLPEAIRPLSVSLLTNERDGMKQFEHSIQTIASKVAAINPTRMQASIAAAEDKLNQLHAKIANIDGSIAERAAKHMRRYACHGREMAPEEMAKFVLEHADTHQWFDDEPPLLHDGSVPFDDSAVNALRRARMAVAGDLPYLGHSLPEADAFPPWPELLTLHRDLAKAKAIDDRVVRGDVLAPVDSQPETLEKAGRLLDFLSKRADLRTKIAAANVPWGSAVIARFTHTPASDPALQALMGIVAEARGLEQRRRQLLTEAIALPANVELSVEFSEAVTRLAEGKSAFSLPFGKREARKMVAETLLAGAPPSSTNDWDTIRRALIWRVDARRVMARWNALSGDFGVETPDPELDIGFRQIAGWCQTVEACHSLVFAYDSKLRERVEGVFGKAATEKWNGGESLLGDVCTSLRALLDQRHLAYAHERQQGLEHLRDGCQGQIVDGLQSFLSNELGEPSADEAALHEHWFALLGELRRLAALRPFFDEITRVTADIEEAGAIKWAKRLRSESATSDLDPVTPADWLGAWNWRQAVMLLDSIDGHKQLRALFDERRTLAAALARTYQDLVAEKTWLGVFNNSPPSIRQALQTYLQAIQAMGAGTGVRAMRHRRTAREAMTRAYEAVPCWVLPLWRVSEAIPPELALFDLVVIDEASQSDIWALPALLRGKKLLVVGDHKQVSPSAVGFAEEKVKELMGRFLADQPFGSEMTPDKSIYDLARVVFAGNSVMLKEHFRCVPAIIEFSNREFYQGDIRPLRVPKANERLDPPLVDVFVKGGFRKADANPAEAQAVVDEIKSILKDAKFDGRSIGVVTLRGTAQAALIHELVSRQISPLDVVSRKIAIGPPPVFQGAERDIMLVSMVMVPGEPAAANRADMFQRFNVALSRARDRMYLFRSVAETAVAEDSLNGKVISHFMQPFRRDVREVQALRERCESGFELEMFDELVNRGFRVEPQVRCGGYRIDFVVEGNEGRRLAIECDGDRFHGPGQWKDDMTRQRVLERAGWTFWRCFASTFVRQREAVIGDLMQTLARLRIEPLGSDAIDSTVWAQHKEVDPYGVEARNGETEQTREAEIG